MGALRGATQAIARPVKVSFAHAPFCPVDLSVPPSASDCVSVRHVPEYVMDGEESATTAIAYPGLFFQDPVFAGNVRCLDAILVGRTGGR